jgi:hypothetical protein
LYNKSGHEYEIKFNSSTKVVEVQEEIKFKLDKVALDNLKGKDFVDVMGIVIDCGELSKYASNNGKELSDKRAITIMDESLKTVICTLWNNHALLTIPLNSVIVLKRAKVNEVRGITLGATTNTIVEIDPNNEEALALKNWFSMQSNFKTTNVSDVSLKEVIYNL